MTCVADGDGRVFGAVVRVHGMNFAIENCDLLATNALITMQDAWNETHTLPTGEKSTAWTENHGAAFGIIANNALW